MKIRRISAYRVELPLHEGSYKWSGGKSVSVFDSTIVAVETDEGLTGHGEVCPLGPFYLPAYANGAQCGNRGAGPAPDRARSPADRQAESTDGRRPARAPVRQVGHRHGLLGPPRQGQRAAGPHPDGGPLRRRLRALSGDLPGGSRGDGQPRGGLPGWGYRRFQLKVGGDPHVDIARIRAVAAELQPGDRLVADANTGWLMHDALRVVRAVRDIDVYIEQPCRTL
ncbi:MAG: mandelate racemase/muconate lactonizing enzyme family protein [Isosphaeraceae bacterium]